jgi:hypothetical protein
MHFSSGISRQYSFLLCIVKSDQMVQGLENLPIEKKVLAMFV